MINRRNFIGLSLFGLISGWVLASINIIVQFLLPPPKAYKTKDLSIPLAQIPPGSSTVVNYKGAPVIVVNADQGVVAFDAACTHLGCIVKWVSDQQIFFCPCHAGKFDQSGKVLSGPPPEPLHPIKVEVIDDNIVFL
ncbi:hypothetical protein UR09_05635 [Candidatus Nitromaritima sp. SCGC AAA799-A02]|nr:hypothetical protein UR09_05635 [Candidatus Nitromaritima sp. SCGC AAA799-A02]KMP11439.1 hypothetical protein UZ36_04485 [Candidatus Nitromaritima sp. SCGC AAA799-C22]